MAKWVRDICGSEFEFSDWGVNVVSKVKPTKYAGLTDAEHWEQVATFECAGLAILCQHIVDNYAVSSEPLGEKMPESFGINGTLVYNDDLTVTMHLPDYTQQERDSIQAQADSDLGAGKVIIND